MSEKVTPLHPERERRRKLRRRVLTLGGVTLAVLLAVGLYLFRDRLNLDRLRRMVTYLGADTAEGFGQYAYEAHGNSAFAAFEDGLAVASVTGLDVYGDSGQLLTAVSDGMTAPALSVGGGLVAAWDVGGKTLCAADSGGAVLERTSEYPLLDVSASDGGEICYAEAADNYRTVLTVLDQRQQERFRWYSTARYLPQCALSEDGDQLAAVALGQSGGAFESSLLLLDPAVEEQTGAEVSLGGQLIYELQYLSRDRLCAVGESSLQLFDRDGAAVGAWDYGGSFLMGYSLDGDGYAALSLNRYQAGSSYSVATVDHDGTLLAETFVGEEILSVSAAGRYVAVLTADRLRIYTAADLELYAETAEVLGAFQADMRPDGSALLIGSDGAQLYLP